jgi:alkylation response protein AidB-like acyl-CoA dehydrogenase
MMDRDLSPDHQRLVERLARLTREKVAPRAAQYDASASFPKEDFDDLFHEGYLAAAVPAAYGGLGLGPLCGSTLTLWALTGEVARANLALARCWEGHMNSMVLIDGLAEAGQKERWFAGVVERGEIWVAWSGEPQTRGPDGSVRAGTGVERVDGGFVVDGSKVFATSATGARRAILLVNTAGPGGARHAASAEGLLLLVCDLKDPSVSVDGSWWDPIGMRATVSHRVCFQRTFIPDADQLGKPGQYLTDGWQTRFIPHYAASFLGAAEAAYEYAVDYLKTQSKSADPYVLRRVGQMSVDLETGRLWLAYVARLWDTGRAAEAQIAGSSARHAIEHLALATVEHTIRTCGARCLNRPSPIERIHRDLVFYVRHDNDDQLLATLGRAVFGELHDPSFYKP